MIHVFNSSCPMTIIESGIGIRIEQGDNEFDGFEQILIETSRVVYEAQQDGVLVIEEI